MNKINFAPFLLLLILLSCNRDKESQSEKHLEERDVIVNLKDLIVDIKSGVPFVFSVLYIVDDVFLVLDYKSKSI